MNARGRDEPPTYWLRQTSPNPFPPPAALPATAQVVVVGGGLMGTATTYWLARLGREVLMVEARQIAWGASGRNAGICLPGLDPVEDPALLTAVLAEECIDAGYRHTGHLSLAASDGMLDQFRAEVRRRPAGATPLSILDRSACEEVLRMPISPKLVGGRWDPVGHVVQPARLVVLR